MWFYLGVFVYDFQLKRDFEFDGLFGEYGKGYVDKIMCNGVFVMIILVEEGGCVVKDIVDVCY